MVKSSGSPEHLGKTAIVTPVVEGLNACFSNFVQRLRPSSAADSRFIWYVLNSKMAADEMAVMGNTTTGLRNLNGRIIGSVPFPGPPLNEQRAIADFLDAETARIDALITKKRRLVELLNERFSGLVSDLVWQNKASRPVRLKVLAGPPTSGNRDHSSFHTQGPSPCSTPRPWRLWSEDPWADVHDDLTAP